MGIKRLVSCRSAGKVYSLLRIPASQGKGARAARLLVGERELPASLFALERRKVRELGLDASFAYKVLVMPFLNSRVARVEILEHGTVIDSFPVRFDALKVASILAYRTKPALCAAIRDFDCDYCAGGYYLAFDHGFQGAEDDVWRIRIDWQGDADAQPGLAVYGADGEPLEFTSHVFEYQPGLLTQDGVRLHRLYLSVLVKGSPRDFVIVARDSSGHVASGFCSLDGRFFNALRGASDAYMSDACADDEVYRHWFERHRATPGQLATQRAAERGLSPLVSIVVPCFRSNGSYLVELIDSVLAQSYARWELLLVDGSPEDGVVAQAVAKASDGRIRIIAPSENTDIVSNTNVGIEASRGELIAFLDHDDLLEPDALHCYVAALEADSGISVLYSDEDHIGEGGLLCQPVFKSALDVDLLYSHNCVTHFLAVRAELLDQIGLSSVDVAGAQDYDLALRALAAGAKFKHIPRVLYHWRMHAGSTAGDSAESKPYAHTAGRLALGRHFVQRGISATVEDAGEPFVYRVCYELPQPHPLVSVVIPSRDQADMLEECVASFLEHSTYDNLEFVIVENNSEQPETFACYDRLIERGAGRVRIVTWKGEGFNYSSLINFGVAASSGEYLLLLNNDTALISPDAIEEMLGYLQRPEVGVVGAKLYFRDGLTQHIGMLIGPGQACAHVNQNFPPARGGYRGRATRPSDYSAVTGACQMVRRAVFDKVGGYNEAFAVGFNDVDFCLRVREAGYLVVCTPYAELYHYEFTSRGRELADQEKLVRWKREQGMFIQAWPRIFTEGDPYGNPAFDSESTYFGLGE